MNKKDIARDIYDMVEGDKDLFFEIASSEMTNEEANQYWNEILDDEEVLDDDDEILDDEDVIDDEDGYDGIVFNRWYADMVRIGIPIEWDEML